MCAQCGFANAWIPLCLWCEWTSTEATKQFEAHLPRPRRLSAPSRAVPAPKTTGQYPRRKMSADSTISCAGLHTPQSRRATVSTKRVPGITTVLGAFHCDVCHDERRPDPHNVEAAACSPFPFSVVSTNTHNIQKQTVDGGSASRVATATSITVLISYFSSTTVSKKGKCTDLRLSCVVQPLLPTSSLPNVALESEIEPYKRNGEDRDLKRNSMRNQKGPPALRVRSPPKRTRASCSPAPTVERTRPDDVMSGQAKGSATSIRIETSATPRSTGSMDISDGGHMDSTLSISSSQCSPKHGLRRTKNMTLAKRGSSVSVRSRSPLRESVDAYSTSPVESRQSHALSLTSSPDHDTPPVRLGHPSRPYYSVIRKEMSRPTSPVFSIVSPRTPSPIPSPTDYVPRGTRSLDCGDRSGIQCTQQLRPMSMVLSGQSPIGGSISGEMELRMDLAQWRRENTPDEPGGYRFRETIRSSSKANMKGRVKQLGRGLKEFVLGGW